MLIQKLPIVALNLLQLVSSQFFIFDKYSEGSIFGSFTNIENFGDIGTFDDIGNKLFFSPKIKNVWR